GAGSLAIKNVLPSLDKILDWRIRRQDEFLGGILTQLRNAVSHPQKEADERHIKRKHLQECPHTPASLVTNSRFWLQCWWCYGMQHRLFLLMPLRPQMGQPEDKAHEQEKHQYNGRDHPAGEPQGGCKRIRRIVTHHIKNMPMRAQTGARIP